MMCEQCRSEAQWLIVTPGLAWVGRVCNQHLKGAKADPTARAYRRTT